MLRSCLFFACLASLGCDWRTLDIDSTGGAGGLGAGGPGGRGGAGAQGEGGAGAGCETCGGDSCVDLVTDELNCGACAFACWDATEGRCTDGTCRIYAPSASVHALAFDAGRLYWDDGKGHLLRWNGSTRLEDLSPVDTGLGLLLDLQVGGGYLYAAHYDDAPAMVRPMRRLAWDNPRNFLDVTWDTSTQAGAIRISLRASSSPASIAWTSFAGGFVRQLSELDDSTQGPSVGSATWAISIRDQNLVYSLYEPAPGGQTAYYSSNGVNGELTETRPDSFGIGSDGDIFWSSSDRIGCITSDGVTATVDDYAPDLAGGPLYVSEGAGEALYYGDLDSAIWQGDLGCPALAAPRKISEGSECIVLDFVSDPDGSKIFFARYPAQSGDASCAGVFMRSANAPPL